MNRTAIVKTLAGGALMAAIGIFGSATAHADVRPPCSVDGSAQDSAGGGADVSRTETNGSNAIRTSPQTTAEPGRYGPYVSPDNVWIVAD